MRQHPDVADEPAILTFELTERLVAGRLQQSAEIGGTTSPLDVRLRDRAG
jgi:hypothetical protein